MPNNCNTCRPNPCRCGGRHTPVVVDLSRRCSPCIISGPYRCCIEVVDRCNRPACGERVTLTEVCSGVSVSAVTNCSGKIIFNCLPAGRYICTLVGAKNGYGRNVSQRILIDRCNPCPTLCFNTGSLKCSGRIVINLRSCNPGKPLEGGTFKLFDEHGKYLGERTTNEKGQANYTNLQLGEYYLIQTKAPHGYKKDPKKYKIILDKNNKCEEVNICNEKKRCGFICLCLKECCTKKPICGATFALYDCHHKKIDCEVTNRKGCLIFKHLEVPGRYYIKQLTTAPGYHKIHRPIEVCLFHHKPHAKVMVCNHKKRCECKHHEEKETLFEIE